MSTRAGIRNGISSIRSSYFSCEALRYSSVRKGKRLYWGSNRDANMGKDLADSTESGWKRVLISERIAVFTFTISQWSALFLFKHPFSKPNTIGYISEQETLLTWT
jgi:hypothetical protein